MKKGKINHGLKYLERIWMREKEIEIVLSNQKRLDIQNIKYSEARKEYRSEKGN